MVYKVDYIERRYLGSSATVYVGTASTDHRQTVLNELRKLTGTDDIQIVSMKKKRGNGSFDFGVGMYDGRK